MTIISSSKYLVNLYGTECEETLIWLTHLDSLVRRHKLDYNYVIYSHYQFMVKMLIIEDRNNRSFDYFTIFLIKYLSDINDLELCQRLLKYTYF